MLVRLIKEAAGGRGGSVLIEGEPGIRSEEHTSELQSQSNLVCRLLLEKKKKRESNIAIIRIRSISAGMVAFWTQLTVFLCGSLTYQSPGTFFVVDLRSAPRIVMTSSAA